jgi:hypothetical protein
LAGSTNSKAVSPELTRTTFSALDVNDEGVSVKPRKVVTSLAAFVSQAVESIYETTPVPELIVSNLTSDDDPIDPRVNPPFRVNAVAVVAPRPVTDAKVSASVEVTVYVDPEAETVVIPAPVRVSVPPRDTEPEPELPVREMAELARSTLATLPLTIEVPSTEAVEIRPALFTVNLCTPAADAVNKSWDSDWLMMTLANPLVSDPPTFNLADAVAVDPIFRSAVVEKGETEPPFNCHLDPPIEPGIIEILSVPDGLSATKKSEVKFKVSTAVPTGVPLLFTLITAEVAPVSFAQPHVFVVKFHFKTWPSAQLVSSDNPDGVAVRPDPQVVKIVNELLPKVVKPLPVKSVIESPFTTTPPFNVN